MKCIIFLITKNQWVFRIKHMTQKVILRRQRPLGKLNRNYEIKTNAAPQPGFRVVPAHYQSLNIWLEGSCFLSWVAKLVKSQSLTFLGGGGYSFF